MYAACAAADMPDAIAVRQNSLLLYTGWPASHVVLFSSTYAAGAAADTPEMLEAADLL